MKKLTALLLCLALVAGAAVLCADFFTIETNPSDEIEVISYPQSEPEVAYESQPDIEETEQPPEEVPEAASEEVAEKEVLESTPEPEVEVTAVEEVLAPPAEEDEMPEVDNQLVCTLSVRCGNALGKAGEKEEILPPDGIIFAEQSVVFYEGESVFDVLLREMKANKIHLEFVNTPIYNSAYIKGINNLYEYDCGSLSGWIYKVNGSRPGYGCSQYKLENGDKIEWIYTCNSGKDTE